jgi:PTH1 family peptidyl-tRNA hydrolase
MMSIIGALGTLDVPRLRIGVGGPPEVMEMRDWVLGKFSREQRGAWPDVEESAWNALLKWLDGTAGQGFTVHARAER